MTSTCLVPVIGTGVSAEQAFRPNVTGGYVVMMIDTVKKQSLVITHNDNPPAPAETLVTGTSTQDLKGKLWTSSPSKQRRTSIDVWLTTNGYTPLTAAQVTWEDVIHYIARQVNPAADLTKTEI